ncbi:MAG: CvpA family protein [Lachnospiraceae bacterium]
MNILLIVVVVYLLVMLIRGYMTGAVRMLLSLVGTIVTLVLAYILSPYVSNFLETYTPVRQAVESGVAQYLGEPLEEELQKTLDDWEKQQKEELKEAENQALDGLSLPKSWLKLLRKNNTEEQYKALEVDNFIDYVNKMVANVIVSCISFSILFIIIKIIIWALLLVSDAITSLPLIHQVNGLAGVAVALVEALLMLWCLSLVLSAFSTTSFGQSCMAQISDSIFLQLIYNNNPLMKLL